jgi:Na+-transporting NADH:ubiquinone oxidoreductase subunit B
VPSKTAKYIKWQLPMQRVLYALVPIVISGVYFYGWRALLMVAVSNATAFIAEYSFTSKDKQPCTSAAFVTGTLFALGLPPLLPMWMVVLGAAFGIVFGKMVFGGFGKNVFNPALTGRAFLYISFGDWMTARGWTHAIPGVQGRSLFPGGFLSWTAQHSFGSDAITQATPGSWLTWPAERLAEAGVVPEFYTWTQLFIGNIPGVIGGTSAIIVIIGGLYLLFTKTANYRVVVPCIIGYLLSQSALYFAGAVSSTGTMTAEPLHSLFAGSVLFAVFFYATDPVSAPKTNEARWLYGAFIGLLYPILTTFSVWPAAAQFCILLANMFAPITDYAINSVKGKKKS